ncbi:unnamed protein product, partial [Symbiodinium pilosum]
SGHMPSPSGPWNTAGWQWSAASYASGSWWWHSPSAWPGGAWNARDWWELGRLDGETRKGHVRRWMARDQSASDAGERVGTVTTPAASVASVEPEGPATASEPAPSVRQALTVQGSQQGRAMIAGRKQIENRSWRIPVGWYALHVGSRPLAALGDEWVQRTAAAMELRG